MIPCRLGLRSFDPLVVGAEAMCDAEAAEVGDVDGLEEGPVLLISKFRVAGKLAFASAGKGRGQP